MTQQEARQAAVRAVTGTALDYDGDWEALFDAASIAKGDFNGRMLAWINHTLGTTYTEINGALQALAANNNAFNFSSMGTFNAGSAPAAFAVPMVTMFTQNVLEWIGGFPDNAHGVVALYLQGSNGTAAHDGTTMQGMTILNKVIIGNSSPDSNTEAAPGFNLDFDLSATVPGTVRLNMNDATGGPTHGTNGVIASTNWKQSTTTQLLFAYDTGQASGAKKACFFLNGVQVPCPLTDNGTTSAFNVHLAATLNFYLNVVGATFLGAVMSVGQVFFDTPTTAPVDSSGNPTFAITKFWNNGPVNINGNNGGVWPLGAQPLVLLEGPASQFETNQGTGGNPTKVYANTKLQRVSDVHFGPGSTPDRPYQAWEAPCALNSGAIFSKAAGTYGGMTNFGRPITLGMLLVVHVQIEPSNTAFDYDPVVNSTAADISASVAWTRAPNSKQVVAGTRPISTVVYTKPAIAADVTAAGADWANVPAITWTTAGSPVDTFGASGWCLNAYLGSVAGVAPILIDSQSQQNAANVGLIAPLATTTSAKALLVNIFNLYNWNDVSADYGPPTSAGQNCRLICASGGAAASLPIWSDEQINAIGATGTRTATCSSVTIRNNTANSLILQ